MTDEKKPREFSIDIADIETSGTGLVCSWISINPEVHKNYKYPPIDFVHVIEFEAYEQAQARIKELEEQLKAANDVDDVIYPAMGQSIVEIARLMKENKRLEAENILNIATIAKLSEENAELMGKLKIAKDVLEFYCENETDVYAWVGDGIAAGWQMLDRGERARAALAKIKVNEKVEGENAEGK